MPRLNRQHRAASAHPRTVFGIILLVVLTGCRPDRPTEVPAGDVVAVDGAEPEWAAQVAAVRAGEADKISVRESTVTAADLAELSQGCDRLRVLEIDDCVADDAALAVIGRLPQLRMLLLGAEVGDAGMQQLAAAERLATLNLPQGRFSDEGLREIAALPELQLLRFHSPHVTDEGLAHIAGMQSLRFLHLIDVPITDAGLPQLHGMTQLESFYLDGGDCSDAALGELLRALPQLHFHRDQLHLPDDPRAHPHQL